MKKVFDRIHNQETIIKALLSAKASMEVEGFVISDEQVESLKRLMLGEIEKEEYIRENLKL
jgi:hypothetical protein